MNIARAEIGRIAIDRTKLTVGSREFEIAWLDRRSFVQADHPTLPLSTIERRARNLPCDEPED